MDEKKFTIENLVAELDRLWAMPDETYHDSNGRIYMNVGGDQAKYEAMQELTDTALTMCDRLLIEKGRPNWENIRKLEASGYTVRCTEKDSFGWLGAAIDKSRRSLYFG